ncbi:MAG: leucine-rich repeat domain-containing protein [Marinifilaceae bacterium]
MKKNILFLFILFLGFSCSDFLEGDTLDPVVEKEQENKGVTVQNTSLYFDATGVPAGLSLRSIEGSWTLEADKSCDWINEITPSSGAAGNAIVAISLKENASMEDRESILVLRHEGGDTLHVLLHQYTYETKYSRKTDSLALLALYKSLDKYEAWRTPWDEKKNITTWNGLTFEEIRGEQRVVGIRIMEWNQQGEVPKEIGNLKELRSLSIQGGYIQGKVPDAITSLRKLESFNIAYGSSTVWYVPTTTKNMLSLKEFRSGQIRIASSTLTNLYDLPNVETIALSVLDGELPDGISKMEHLKELNLSMSGVTQLPDDLGNVTSLEIINLSNCGKLREIPVTLSNATNLKVVKLNGCPGVMELPETMGQINTLEELNLSGCGIATLPENITGWKNLLLLNIERCNNLLSLPENIGELPKLKQFQFSNCSSLQSLPESIVKLPIENLNLSNCSSLSTLPENMGELSQLTEINLSGCSSLSLLPESFGQLANLKKITFSTENELQLPSSFGNLVALETINGGKYGTGPGVVADLSLFSTLTSLKVLNLSSNHVTGSLSNLKDLVKLQDVNLSNTKIDKNVDFSAFITPQLNTIILSGNGLQGTLNGITLGANLTRIQLDDNELSGNLPEDITNCIKLTTLNLTNNNITGNIPDSYASETMKWTWAGLLLKNNCMSGKISTTVQNSSFWKQRWYPDNNILPQKEGFGLEL